MDGRSTVTQTGDDGLSEADGVHDGLDLGHPIIQRANFWHRVRKPDPGLVEQKDATERGELLNERFELGEGPGQLDVADERPDEDEFDRPVAKHLIRQAQITARCVQRFRHRISVLLIPPLAGARVIPPGYLHLVIAHAGRPGMTLLLFPCVFRAEAIGPS